MTLSIMRACAASGLLLLTACVTAPDKPPTPTGDFFVSIKLEDGSERVVSGPGFGSATMECEGEPNGGLLFSSIQDRGWHIKLLRYKGKPIPDELKVTVDLDSLAIPNIRKIYLSEEPKICEEFYCLDSYKYGALQLVEASAFDANVSRAGDWIEFSVSGEAVSSAAMREATGVEAIAVQANGSVQAFTPPGKLTLRKTCAEERG